MLAITDIAVAQIEKYERACVRKEKVHTLFADTEDKLLPF